MEYKPHSESPQLLHVVAMFSPPPHVHFERHTSVQLTHPVNMESGYIILYLINWD